MFVPLCEVLIQYSLLLCTAAKTVLEFWISPWALFADQMTTACFSDQHYWIVFFAWNLIKILILFYVLSAHEHLHPYSLCNVTSVFAQVIEYLSLI